MACLCPDCIQHLSTQRVSRRTPYFYISDTPQSLLRLGLACAMSSLSSFPAFASFPDLDPGPSTRTPTPREERKERREHKKSRRDEDREGDSERKKKKPKPKHREREDGERVRHKRRSRSPSPTRERGRYGLDDDERRKREEDRGHRGEDGDRRSAKQGLVYFTDQKGDPLNVRYGGLHVGDVPRYRLVGGMSCLVCISDN